MKQEDNRSKRMGYDPRFLKLLIEKSLEVAEFDTNNSSSRIKLSTSINSKFNNHKRTDTGYLSDAYLDKMYAQAEIDIRENRITKYFDTKIESLVKYVGFHSFEEFIEAHVSEVVAVTNPTQEHTPVAVNNQMKIGKIFDSYDRRARLLPLSLGLLPLILLLISLPFNRLITSTMSLQEIGSIVGLGVVGIVYCVTTLSDLVSGLSKVYQNKYFIKANGFPSTYLMLYQDPTYSVEYKDKYRLKILQLTGIKLLSKEEELIDKVRAIQALNTATEYVKQYVYEGLVKTQNIRYGFTRNLIGATFLGIPFSIMTAIVGILSSSITLIVLSTGTLVLYSVILIFKKHLLHEAAESYAKELFANFLKDTIK